MAGDKKQPTAEFKRKAVQAYVNRGTKPVGALVKELGVNSSALYRWVAEAGGIHELNKEVLTEEEALHRKAAAAFHGRGERPLEDIAAEFGLSVGMVYYWAKKYPPNEEPKVVEKPAPSSPVARGSSRYSDEFRRKAVRQALNSNGLSVEQVAASLGLHRSVLYAWIKAYREEVTGQVRRNERVSRETSYDYADAPDEAEADDGDEARADADADEDEGQPEASEDRSDDGEGDDDGEGEGDDLEDLESECARYRRDNAKLKAEADALRRTIVVLGESEEQQEKMEVSS
jgi:transposase-like protein